MISGPKVNEAIRMHRLREAERAGFIPEGAVTETQAEDFSDPDDPEGFHLEIKRRRRTAQLKQMLADAGYGELARMISVKEGE